VPDLNDLFRNLGKQNEELKALVDALNRQSDVLKPLVDKTPQILQLVEAYETSRSVGRGFVVMGNSVKWAGMVAIGIAAIWAILKGKFMALLGNQPG